MSINTIAMSGFLASSLLSTNLHAEDFRDDNRNQTHIEHVLLISVDGLHALDVDRYVKTHPHSALAELFEHGVNYSNAATPANSDSFPGLLALATGGSPVSHGVFYDVSYDRSLFDPTNTHCTGEPGNIVVFDESIDRYDVTNVSQDVIDSSKLPRKLDSNGNCIAVYPHNFVKTNTIFEVVSASGKHTAWADKHPAYDLINGPSGHGVTDLYTPEITNVNGFDATTSVVCTVENDRKKVAAVINEINGKRHDGTPAGYTPALFGMNFQAVSVGQKVAQDNAAATCNKTDGDLLRGKPGGYTNATGTPSEVLNFGLEKTDAALEDMIEALKKQHIYDSTLFIVSAKHGQSPIDPMKTNKPGHLVDLVASLPDGRYNPAALIIAAAGNCTTGACGLIQDDDVALIWLQNQNQTGAVADYLNANAKALSIQNVLAGASLYLKFNNPLTDNRTPDIIVQPEYGTIYTTSKKKNAEHGGFSFGDTNVGLLISNPHFTSRTIKTPVTTAQVAPTILRALDLNTEALKAVRIEHTTVLPGWNNAEEGR